ncbi:Dehydrogenase/reductase SDR family member 1 [Durusdinium trenchii]|uniref:Dehydrogenase/reductase SDR family member 1 n=1 Tax=Durusdinium trenchii TaxID=1381693 RepID=A0ABP0SGC8_9DINO
MENLTTGAVLKDKLTNIASDLMSKVDHTVQNLGKTKPSEDAPITFKVVHRGGALVRSGFETTSSQVHQLSEGEIATVVEQAGRRVRIISPVEGWVSVETKDGVTIMRPTTLQRRGYKQEAFESHFESKFERLKAKQRQGGGYEDDPRAESSWRRDRSDERNYDRYDDRRFDDRRDGAEDWRADRRNDRPGSRRDDRRNDHREERRDDWRDERRDDGREKPKAEDKGGLVPRLAAPGQKAGPAVVEVQRPPTSGASSGGFGSADLLSMEEHQAPQVSSAPAWDPFESGPVGAHAPAPAMIAAPWDAFGGQQAEGAWDAFQSSSTPSTGSNAQAPFNPNEGCSSRSGCMSGMHMGTGAPMSGIGCMGGCGMGTMTGGCLGGLGNIGMGGMCNQPMGQQPMGYGMGCMGCMGGAGCMQGSGCVAGPAGRGMAAGNPSMPNMPGGSLRGPAGTSGPLAPLTAPGSQADDLMSKTMAGGCQAGSTRSMLRTCLQSSDRRRAQARIVACLWA